ncbi:MAG: carboxylesterase/lipase family protein [Rhizobiaceae bacterium]|nr:carboxylesterase/lipase family protein [Rhizobiaceae bacterium]
MTVVSVATSCEVVNGRRTFGISRFLGIPYAEPPMGEARFAAPRRRVAFTRPFDAFAYGASAPQRRSLPEPLARIAGTLVRFDEDCLHLNIWTPDTGAKLPVLVFIHGGGFVIGSGAQYPGGDLATRGDIVVVTINYRLGLLGFNAFDEVFEGDRRFAANAGLLDQVIALEWVRDNIEAFGGDPEAVTIAGESAGAVSVAFHLVHDRSAPLFHKAVVQSGGLNLFYPKGEAVRVTRDILSEMGALRDPSRLLRFDTASFGRAMGALRHRHIGILSRPYVDGTTIPDLPLPVLYDRMKPVPLIVGTNRDEFSFFTELPMFPVKSDMRSLQAMVAAEAGQERAKIVRALYRDTKKDRIALGTDIMFRMPAIHLADAHALRAPTFSYRLDWEAKGVLSGLGATHSVDLPLLFEDFLKPFRSVYLGLLPDHARHALGERMRDHWVAFVRDGRPGPAWPLYRPDARRTMILGVKDRVADDPEATRRLAFAGVDGFTL